MNPPLFHTNTTSQFILYKSPLPFVRSSTMFALLGTGLAFGVVLSSAAGLTHRDISNITARSLPSGWQNDGCVSDSSTRLLSKLLSTSKSTTVLGCVNSCISAGYKYAGLQNSDEVIFDRRSLFPFDSFYLSSAGAAHRSILMQAGRRWTQANAPALALGGSRPSVAGRGLLTCILAPNVRVHPPAQNLRRSTIT